MSCSRSCCGGLMRMRERMRSDDDDDDAEWETRGGR